MSATQKQIIQSEINVLNHAALVVADHIHRTRGLYHTDDDLPRIKALIDTIILCSNILSTDEIQYVLNVLTSGVAYIATAQQPGLQHITDKLDKERRAIAAFLRFRSEL